MEGYYISETTGNLKVVVPSGDGEYIVSVWDALNEEFRDVKLTRLMLEIYNDEYLGDL